MAKVLIVEDTSDIATALQALIEYEGHEATIALNAAEGYSLTLSIRPHLIVMDVVLPDEDGLHLTRRIRSTAEIKQPIIVCVSSFLGEGVEKDARMSGCDEIFSKTTFMVHYQKLLERYFGEKPE